MKIVIDITEWQYKSICEGIEASKRCGVVGIDPTIHKAIANGTPLPKGYGDLIDVRELRQDIVAHKYSMDYCKEHNIDQSIDVGILNILLADAPTIIEADKGVEE